MADDKDSIGFAVKKQIAVGLVAAFGALGWWGWENMTKAAQLEVRLEAKTAICNDITAEAAKLIADVRELKK